MGFCLALLGPIIAGFVILGWDKRGHGLTSRPRETAAVAFLDELSVLFRYPPGSAPARMSEILQLKLLLGMRAKFLLGCCPFLVGLLIVSLMVVRRLVWFGLNHVFRIVWMILLVLIACMIVLELTGQGSLMEVAKESD